MEPSIDELRKNYERFDDNKLIRLASEEATRLRPEALELLKQIIKERGLSTDVLTGIEAQFKQPDEKSLRVYTDLLRKQSCPICDSTAQPLNATMVASVMSFIVFTHYKKELVIGCPDCLDKQNNNAMLKSALMGWWSLPWGLIRTPKSLMLNSKMKKQNHNYEANDLFKSFTLQRIGRIEANKNNPEQLQLIVKHIR